MGGDPDGGPGLPGAGHSTRPVGPIVATMLGALGTALAALGTGKPQSAWDWLMLCAGSLLGGGAVGVIGILVTGLFDRLLIWAGVGVAKLRALTTIRTVTTVVVASLLTLGVYMGTPPAVAGVQSWLHGCPFPAELRVLTSPEELRAVTAWASAYQRSTADADGGCPTVNPYVYAAALDETMRALETSWQLNALRDIGPRPDVWLPDSTWEVAQVRAQPGLPGVVVPLVDDGPLAYSPIVLAVPTDAVDPDPQARQKEATWDELFNRVQTRGWGLVRPDPAKSVVGAFANVALYQDPGRVDELEHLIDVSLDRGSYPLGDSDDLLCRLRHAAAESGGSRLTTAVITTEQAMVRFNQGGPLGSGCPLSGDSLPGPPLLHALYPTDRTSLDHPFVRFDWSDTNAAQSRAAEEFGRWLRSDEGKRELVSAGLRPPRYQVEAPLTEDYGAFPAAIVGGLPDGKAVETAQKLYVNQHRPARVLVAVDASGSMGRAAGGQSGTRFQAAATGIRTALDRLRSQDEYELWAFSTSLGRDGYWRLVPTGAGNASTRAASTTAALAGVELGGGTPLYATIAAGVGELSWSGEEASRALVVLTDGHDTSGSDGSETVAAVHGKKVRVFVVAIGEASCAGLIATLTADTGGDCRPATPATLNAVLIRFFETLRGGAPGGG